MTNKPYERKDNIEHMLDYLKLMYKPIIIIILSIIMLHGCIKESHASMINIQSLANAIYRAENSRSHPYGIMNTYKHTSPRQACINTISHRLKLWDGKGDFITYLSKTYAPQGASNDPTNLNKNWIKNVTFFYNKEMSK